VSKKVKTDRQLELPLFAPPDRWEKVLKGVREEIIDQVAALLLDWAKVKRENSVRHGGHDD